MTTLVDLIGPDASRPGDVAGYLSQVPEWSLGGNDKFGDCGFVSVCNLIDVVKAVGGNPQVVGEGEALYFYNKEAGFNSQNPATDRGSVLADVIRYWMENGWPADPTYKPVGFCAIEPVQIHQAVHSLGGAPAWCSLPVDANGDPDWSDNAIGTQPADGHAVLIVQSDPESLTLITWAQPVTVSLKWWHVFGCGQFAVRLPDWRVP
jgi:hypothetical protein